jgi:hypothetical protein
MVSVILNLFQNLINKPLNPNNADIAFASANPPRQTKIYLPKLYINYDTQA